MSNVASYVRCELLLVLVFNNVRMSENLFPQFVILVSYQCVVKLVDPASSHMLVLKIKPCMFKFIPLNGETANGSLNQL